VAFVSQIEQKSVDDSLKDHIWFLALQDELNQFQETKLNKSLEQNGFS